MGSRDGFVEATDFSISIDFQLDFCKAFLDRPSFDTLGSILPRHLGEEALEPFLDPPRDPLVFEDGVNVGALEYSIFGYIFGRISVVHRRKREKESR